MRAHSHATHGCKAIVQETVSCRQNEPGLQKLEQRDEAGPRSPWGHHPASSSSTSSSSASRSTKKVCPARAFREASMGHEQLSTVDHIEALLCALYSAKRNRRDITLTHSSPPQALTVRSCGVLALPDAGASQVADAYTIPAVHVRVDSTERHATSGAASAKTKGVIRQHTADAPCRSTALC